LIRLLVALWLVLLPPAPLRADEAGGSFPFDAETLIRRVVRSQKESERRLSSYTFDQLETRTDHGKDGRPKETSSRLYFWTSSDEPGEGSRELVAVDDRPATEDEKRKLAEDEAKDKRKRLERRAAERLRQPPSVKGDDEDPLVGKRRLSDVIGRFTYRLAGSVERDGRLCWALEFTPREGVTSTTPTEEAFSALAGRALIDATDYQIVQVDAHLTRPVKVYGGLAAKIQEATIGYETRAVTHGRWFPCQVEMHLKGKKVLLFRLDTTIRWDFTGFRSFAVDTESHVEREGEAGPGTTP
jgi:hypothetical protein